MVKLKILNLYAGIGGNRKLWGKEAPSEEQLIATPTNSPLPLIKRDDKQ